MCENLKEIHKYIFELSCSQANKLTDGQTDGQTDRWTNDGPTIKITSAEGGGNKEPLWSKFRAQNN